MGTVFSGGKMKKGLRGIKSWVVENKLETAGLVIILSVGAFLRLYRIGEYMTFLGDEGRDAILVRRLLNNFDLILIGPGTSIGNMYLGPLYYYLIAPSLWMANFSPVGPSALVAFIGVATIFLIWWAGREFFGSTAANIAAFLYAISPTVIIYSRSSWNPNVMPFFALMTIYALWKVWYEKRYWWLIIMGVVYAFVLQSHYLGLLLAPVILVFWVLSLIEARWGGSVKKLLIRSAFGGVIFLFLMSPLLIFDMRHGWINFNAVKTFFSVRQETVSAKPWRAIPKLWPLAQEVTTRLVAGRNELAGKWAAIGMAGSVLWLVGGKKVILEKKKKGAFRLLLVWMGVALIGLGVYKQEIYDHYFGFFFAAVFLFLGGAMQEVVSRHKIRGWWLVGTALVFLVYVNLVSSPLRQPPGKQMARTREVAEKIKEEAGGKRFNLAVIAERNYEDAYQYFLEMWEVGVVDIDPLRYEETVAGELFVVCELAAEKCDPTHNPKAEVANFGWSRVESEWEIGGVRLFKLVHTE